MVWGTSDQRVRQWDVLSELPIPDVPERSCNGRVDLRTAQVIGYTVYDRPLVYGNDRHIFHHQLLRLPDQIGPLVHIDGPVGLLPQARHFLVLVAVVVLSLRRYLVGAKERGRGRVGVRKPGPLAHLELALGRPLAEEGVG